jgi:hypothetical protein
MKGILRLSVLLLLIPVIAFAMPSNFILQNKSGKSLGAVTLYYQGGQMTINVNGQGTWTTETPGTVTSISINGQRSDYPVSRDVTLPSGSKLRVNWKSTNLIEVIDIATQG